MSTGKAILRLLMVWAFLSLLAIIACSQAKDTARKIADKVVDCAAENSPDITAQIAPLIDSVIRAARKPDGTVDWEPVKAALRLFAINTAGCVGTESVLRLAQIGTDPTARSLIGAPDPEELRRGWEQVRQEMFPGVKFKTSIGTL